MSPEQLAQYSRWMGYGIAIGAWVLVLVILRTRRHHIFDGAFWPLLAWLAHVGLPFFTVRLMRDFGAPLQPIISNIWSVVVYLQALISITTYIVLCLRSPSTLR